MKKKEEIRITSNIESLFQYQFSGKWYFSAGIPINASLSRCGQFLVSQTSSNTFQAKFTAISYKNNIPIAVNIDGSVNGKDVAATWQFQGSKRRLGKFFQSWRMSIKYLQWNIIKRISFLYKVKDRNLSFFSLSPQKILSCSNKFINFILFPGPFRHVIISVKYDTILGMLVCSKGTTHHQGYKFVMIWSRERSLPLPIFKELKTKLGAYINQGRIRMVDHGNC